MNFELFLQYTMLGLFINFYFLIFYIMIRRLNDDKDKITRRKQQKN